MQNYCNIVKNKLNSLIRSMEKNVSDYVVDPKKDFVRKSELSFSKTMRFILGMGSQTLGKELMDFYNTIAHLENNGLKYVIRIKTSGGIAQKFNIPHNEETDFTANIIITRRQTNEVKANPELYRHIPAFSNFDFLPKGSKDTYPLKFRLIRLRISEDNYETIVTNLCDDEFSADDIKMIYKMRWGIKTSFRELKYHVGLIAFHSKKKDCVIQEIYASLIMYNFSMLITENILIDDDRHNSCHYKINYAIAIHACIRFFRSAHAYPSLLEELIFLKQHSYDVLLSFTHRFSFSSCHKKSASCDIISILSQLADFLQTFFRGSNLLRLIIWRHYLRLVVSQIIKVFTVAARR